MIHFQARAIPLRFQVQCHMEVQQLTLAVSDPTCSTHGSRQSLSESCQPCNRLAPICPASIQMPGNNRRSICHRDRTKTPKCCTVQDLLKIRRRRIRCSLRTIIGGTCRRFLRQTPFQRFPVRSQKRTLPGFCPFCPEIHGRGIRTRTTDSDRPAFPRSSKDCPAIVAQ